MEMTEKDKLVKAENIKQLAKSLFQLIDNINMSEICDTIKLIVDIEKYLTEMFEMLQETDRFELVSKPVTINKDSKAPPILSVNQMRGIYSALEILWVVAIESNIIIPKIIGNYPKTLIISEKAIVELQQSHSNRISQHAIYNTLVVIYKLSRVSALRHMMSERFLGRLISCTIIFTGKSFSINGSCISDDILSRISEMQNEIIFSSNHDKCDVVYALRHLTSLPHPRIRSSASSFLSSILQHPGGGLMSTLTVYLEDVEEQNTPLLVKIARLVTSIPKYDPGREDISENEHKQRFLCNISSQLVSIYLDAVKAHHTTLCQVCVMIMNRVGFLDMDMLCSHILMPLLRFLSEKDKWSSVTKEENEQEVTSVVHTLFVMTSVVPLTTIVTDALYSMGVVSFLMSMLLYVLEHHVTSHLRATIATILKSIIHISNVNTIAYLVLLVITKSSNHIWGRFGVGDSISWICGPSGGICLSNSIMNGNEHNNSINQEMSESSSLLETLLMPSRSSGKASIDVKYKQEERKDKSAMDMIHPLQGGATGSLSDSVDEVTCSYSDIIAQSQLAGLSKTDVLSEDLDVNNVSKDLRAYLAHTQYIYTTSKRCEHLIDYLKSIYIADTPSQSSEVLNVPEMKATVISELFLISLRSYVGITPSGNEVAANDIAGNTFHDRLESLIRRSKSVSISKDISSLILLIMYSRLSTDILLASGSDVLSILVAIVQGHILRLEQAEVADDLGPSGDAVSGTEKEDTEEDSQSMVSIALNLISTILAIGSCSRGIEEENILENVLLPNLTKITEMDKNVENIQLCSDIILVLLTRNHKHASASISCEESCDSRTSKVHPLLREYVSPNLSSGKESKNLSASKVLDRILVDAKGYTKDQSPAMRALGISKITHALMDKQICKDIKMHNIADIRDIIFESITDGDSFVYLNVVQAIIRLVDLKRSSLMPDLISLFSRREGEKPSNSDSNVENISSRGVAKGNSDQSLLDFGRSTVLDFLKNGVNTTERNSSRCGLQKEIYLPIDQSFALPARSRAVLGEALTFCLKRSGELAPEYIPQIVQTCVQIIKQRPTLPSDDKDLMDKNDDRIKIDILKDMAISVPHEKQGVDGESQEDKAIMHSILQEHVSPNGACSDSEMVRIKKANAFVKELAQAADKMFLRQSAMSLLAEAFSLGGWTATKYLADALDIAINSIRLERGANQESISMRRASVLLIRNILNGLKNKLFQLDTKSSLLTNTDYGIVIINSLMTVLQDCCRNDVDKVVIHHAERSLEIMEHVIYQQWNCGNQVVHQNANSISQSLVKLVTVVEK